MAGSVFGRALGSISCSPLHVASGARRRGRAPDACSDTRWRRDQAPDLITHRNGFQHKPTSDPHSVPAVVSPLQDSPPSMRQMLRAEPHHAIARCKQREGSVDFSHVPTAPLAVVPPTRAQARSPARGFWHGTPGNPHVSNCSRTVLCESRFCRGVRGRGRMAPQASV